MTYLRCTISRWNVDLSSEEALEALSSSPIHQRLLQWTVGATQQGLRDRRRLRFISLGAARCLIILAVEKRITWWSRNSRLLAG